ncbi:Hypothetical predicted protein [Lecanosticta acicola]|uniref:Uncharacterized protein n=1 Tax=Lecanosticta acicola TaxID=111012 RepID=A0AAI8Z6P5_9PEZI|nr:Hypothetical predicted protein [Lecanosticta acicola]
MAEDEDFFSDDDLDALPTNTLDQLEQQAILTSQHPKTFDAPAKPVVQQPSRKQAHNASSLTRNTGLNSKNLPWRAPQPTRLPPAQHAVQTPSAPPPSAPDPPSSDYGFDDEDVIDLDEPSLIIEPAPMQPSVQAPYQRRQYGSKAPLDPETEAAFAAADAELDSQTFGRWQQAPPQTYGNPSGGSIDISALQARIAELEAEQERLRLSEQEARSEALAKQGEIAIVRSNQERITKQYEARLSVMQHLHADESAKQKAELEAQRKERQKMETDNRFLKHDLAQEADRAKRGNGTGRSRAGPGNTQLGTPRKNKKGVLGDGFDDIEIQMTSPSRSKEKSKDQTPQAGAKRRRTANDSPAAPLSFTQPPLSVRHESSEQAGASFDQPQVEAVAVKDGSRYAFMQLLLNHRPYEGHERSVEAMAKYAFPSKPHKTISSLFLDEITSLTVKDDEEICLQVARVLLRMWCRCLEEKYFVPFYLVLDMLRFSLRTELAATKLQLIEEAVPLCTRCIEYVATARARATINRNFAASLDRADIEKLADEREVDETLDFLHELCEAASLSAERKEVFWSNLEVYFVVSMLNKAQPLHEIMTMLRMLGSSARPTSLGVISREIGKQTEQEKQLVDCLTNLLFENLDAPPDEPKYSEDETLEVRIEVLKVFREFCQRDHGTSVLAGHRSVIGRLVRFLDAQVAKLYRIRPPVGLDDSAAEKVTYRLIADTINRTTRLLYHLLCTFDDPQITIQKLQVVHGGYHKFIVSLTRIAFTEQVAFEAGIENEVSEAAHSILDNILNSEDGEAVMKAFETPRSTKGPTAENKPSEETHDGDISMSQPD